MFSVSSIFHLHSLAIKNAQATGSPPKLWSYQVPADKNSIRSTSTKMTIFVVTARKEWYDNEEVAFELAAGGASGHRVRSPTGRQGWPPRQEAARNYTVPFTQVTWTTKEKKKGTMVWVNLVYCDRVRLLSLRSREIMRFWFETIRKSTRNYSNRQRTLLR